MSEIVEEFVNGYCKNYDMARSAICEFVQDEDGLHFDRLTVITVHVPTVRTVR